MANKERPQLLGVFQRNEHQNIILNMAVCSWLGVSGESRLVLYLTPGGQVIGKVIEPVDHAKYMRFAREIRKPIYEIDADDWAYSHMPEGFLAPEDTRW